MRVCERELSDVSESEPVVRRLSDTQAADLYLDLELPEGQERPYTVTNTVQTVDGKTALGGRAQGIGSAYDRLLLRRIRAAAEALMIGAGTLRAEEIEFRFPPELLASRRRRGLPRELVVVLITAGGSTLPLRRRLFALPTPDAVPVILTTARAAESLRPTLPERVRVLVGGDEAVDLPRAFSLLRRDFGARRLVVEGGPQLNGALLAQGLVDEVFLTLAPKIIGGPSPGMVAGVTPPGGPRALELKAAFAYGSELFMRYRVLTPPQT